MLDGYMFFSDLPVLSMEFKSREPEKAWNCSQKGDPILRQIPPKKEKPGIKSKKNRMTCQ